MSLVSPYISYEVLGIDKLHLPHLRWPRGSWPHRLQLLEAPRSRRKSLRRQKQDHAARSWSVSFFQNARLRDFRLETSG